LAQFLQHAARAFDHGVGHAREVCDVDAVRPVGRALLDGPEERHLALRLVGRAGLRPAGRRRFAVDGDVDVRHAVEVVGQRREFVVVGGEERLRADHCREFLELHPFRRSITVFQGS